MPDWMRNCVRNPRTRFTTAVLIMSVLPAVCGRAVIGRIVVSITWEQRIRSFNRPIKIHDLCLVRRAVRDAKLRQRRGLPSRSLSVEIQLATLRAPFAPCGEARAGCKPGRK